MGKVGNEYAYRYQQVLKPRKYTSTEVAARLGKKNSSYQYGHSGWAGDYLPAHNPLGHSGWRLTSDEKVEIDQLLSLQDAPKRFSIRAFFSTGVNDLKAFFMSFKKENKHE